MLSPSKIESVVFYLLILFLPTQLGLHFWPDFAFVKGVRIDYLSPTIYLTDILIFILFIFCFINKKIKLKPNIYFLFFYSLLFIGLLLFKNIEASFFGMLKLTEFIFFGVYVYKNLKIDNKFLKTVSVSIIFESLLSIFQFMNKGSLGGFFYFFGERTFNSQTPNIANASLNGELILRPYGTFSHPNVLAGFLLISISFIFLFAKTKKNYEKFFYVLTILIGSFSLVLTLGRTAVLGLGILIIYKSLQFVKSKSVKNLSLTFSLILLLFFTLLPFSGRFINSNFSDESFVLRKELIISSLSMIKDHPLFGVGINNFLSSLPNYFNQTKNVFYLQPVHNIFLLVFSQIGIIAGFMFIIFLIKAFKTANNNLKFILLIVCFLGFFDHYFLTLQQGQLLFALLLGLCFSKTKTGANLLK